MNEKQNTSNSSLKKKFIKYLLPSVAAMWVFSIYTMVDGIFVSRGVGETALAAVNLSMPYINFIFATSIFFSTGVSTIIAIYLGKKEIKKARQVFSFNIISMVITALAIMILSLLNLERLSLFLGATESTLPMVIGYLRIIMMFIPFFMVSYCLEVLTKTDGFPQLAIIGMIVSACTNIILDYIVVIKLEWGIEGAALATGISQLVSCVFFFYHFISSKSTLKFVKFKWKLKTLKRILSIGFPDAITELTSGIVILLFNQCILKYIGESGVITYSVICYVNTLVLMTMIGITQGAQPLCSYYYGKGEEHTVNTLLKMSLKTIAIVSIVIISICLVFAKGIVGVFITPDNSELFKISVSAFRIYSISFLLVGYNILSSGFCASVEKPLNATIISLSRGLVVISLSLFLLIFILGGQGIWFAPLLSEALCLGISFFVVKKTLSRLFTKDDNISYSTAVNQ